MAIIQVTFDSSKWTAGTGAGSSYGSNGYNASSVFMDADGVTAWAFESGGAGFARFNITTGTMVHQDAAFGIPGTGFYFTAAHQGNAIFLQDGSGHYFVVGSNNNLYKFHIASGTPGTLLNGYEVVDATFNLATLPSFVSVEDACIFSSGGVNYIALVDYSSGKLYVLDADTMTSVGHYSTPDTGRGVQVFLDKNGILWAVFNIGTAPYLDVRLANWTPSNGATSQVLNMNVDRIVTHSTHGLRVRVKEAVYVPATHAVILASPVTNASDVCLIDMTAWTLSTYHPDDISFWVSQTSAFLGLADEGVEAGTLMIEGAPQSPNNAAHVGGVLRIIDPTTLNVLVDINVTSDIIDDTTMTLTPVPNFVYEGQWGIIETVQHNSGNQLYMQTTINNVVNLGAHNSLQGPTAYFDFYNCLREATWLSDPSNSAYVYHAIQLYGTYYEYSAFINGYDSTGHPDFGVNNPIPQILRPARVSVNGTSNSYIEFLAAPGAGGNAVTVYIDTSTDGAPTVSGNNITVHAATLTLNEVVAQFPVTTTYGQVTASITSGSGNDSFYPGNLLNLIGGGDGPAYNSAYVGPALFSTTDLMYPAFAGVAWNSAASKAAVTYSGNGIGTGSPVYLVSTATPQGSLVAVTAAPNPATAGGNVTLTATITGAVSAFPTSGTVQFYDGVTPIGAPASVNGSGQASIITTFLGGSHSITARYSGGS
jgi:hypothetical protein